MRIHALLTGLSLALGLASAPLAVAQAQSPAPAQGAPSDPDHAIFCRYVTGQLTHNALKAMLTKDKTADAHILDVSFQFFFSTLTWEYISKADNVPDAKMASTLSADRAADKNFTKDDASGCLSQAMTVLNAFSDKGYGDVFASAKAGFIRISQNAGFTIPAGFFDKYASKPGNN
jgi:hypothetical protein